MDGDATWMLPSEQVLRPAVAADGFEAVGDGLERTVDVVIVGAGPGGSSIARVLSEGGLDVLVLEEGPSTSRFRPNYAHTARYHMQECGAMVARGRAMMPIAAGRGVGGGTLINSALSFRAPDAILDSWAELLGEPGLSAAAMSPIYDEVSAIIGVGVTPDAIAGENNRLIVRGINRLGLDGGLAPRSTPGCVGCGVCYFGCPSQGKGSSNLTFLPRAADAGCRVQAEVRVDAVLVEDGRAVGVRGHAVHPDTQARGGTVTVRAKRVILSAGGVGTPRLLWTAGLGSKLGPVGEGLHVHPGSTILAECDHTVEMWKGATQGAYFHHPDLPGVLPHTFSAPPEACLIAAGFPGSRWQEGLALLPRLCGMLVMVSDKGTGRVRAFSDGRADITYDFADEDIDRTRRGLVEVARVLQAGGAGRLHVPIHGVPPADTPEELEASLASRDLRDFTLYAAHPMSTCRMHTDPQRGVIGGDGQAHNLPGLYISDASVFPTSLGVNPQLTTMAMGTWLGRRMLQEVGP
jgi:choline dehydrogenase-like flavoprotein